MRARTLLFPAFGTTLLELWHFERPAGRFAPFPNLARHGGRLIGTFEDRGDAMRARRKLRRLPGFRDRPDGFRLLPVPLGTTWWRGGFWQAPDGDGALRGDPSPQRGLAGFLSRPPDSWRDGYRNTPDEIWQEQTRLRRPRRAPDERLWRLDHFKIDGLSHAARPEAGQKRIGLYATLGQAVAAADRLRREPGFYDWPNGFRVRPFSVGRLAWPDGFEAGALEDGSGGRPRKPGVVFELMHAHAGEGEDLPNAAATALKGLGLFRQEWEARATIRQYRTLPGFRDWPDGFRVLRRVVGRGWWREGFAEGPEGEGEGEGEGDVALAGDPSPVRGNDWAIGLYPEEEERGGESRPGRWTHMTPAPLLARALWKAEHFKAGTAYTLGEEDRGWKEVGLYASEAEAWAAVRARRGKPGFRDWPGGFRVNWEIVEGPLAWRDGFYDPDREDEEPGDDAALPAPPTLG